MPFGVPYDLIKNSVAYKIQKTNLMKAIDICNSQLSGYLQNVILIIV